MKVELKISNIQLLNNKKTKNQRIQTCEGKEKKKKKLEKGMTFTNKGRWNGSAIPGYHPNCRN